VIKKRVLLIVTVFSLLLPAWFFASGNPEVGLPKVDRLIKERNYNAAILELANYMTEKPEDFDGAQRRIRKIITMREGYNATALELLMVLVNEPTNDRKKLDMISYLEGLEKNPNKPTQDFIVSTKEASQFTYYRAKFEEIMTAGDRLIDEGRYVEASRKFTEGYVLYKPEYDEATDSATVSKVNANLGSIVSGIGSVSEIQLSLEDATVACEKAIASGDVAASDITWSTLDAELSRLARIRNQIAENGWYLEDSFNALQKGNDTVTESSFLPFAWRFTLGRKTAGRFEGVLGSIDAQYNSVIDRIERATDATILNRWTDGYASISAGDVESGILRLKSGIRFTAFGGAVPQAAKRLASRKDTYGIRNIASESKRYANTGTILVSLSELGNSFDTYFAIKARAEQTGSVEATASHIRAQPSSAEVRAWNTLIGELNILLTKTNRLGTAVAQLEPIPKYTDEFASIRGNLISSIGSNTLALYRSSAAFQDASAALALAEWKKAVADGVAYLNGIPDSSGQTLYYPAESLASFNRARTGIVADRRFIGTAIGALEKAPSDVQGDEAWKASVDSMRKTLEDFNALYATAGAQIANANSRILQANLAKQEYDLRYAQAQAALRRNDFDAARENLQRSREKVNQCLAYQESTTLRADSDRKLESLGAEITRIENEYVVREVRSFISSGKNFYYLGNIDQAEKLFAQAKTRWSATNVEPNAEIANWLDIINTALSMKTGRTIPVSAPLYPQMSQILSSANQLYGEGKVLLEAGRRAEGIAVLSSSKEKLQQLQLVYPMNQEAGQLKLRIDQLIDPVAFKQYFSQKVEYIRANYRTARQTAYSDLLDLYQINSAYPGIKPLLDDVEIYLGIKLPPPNPADIARSTELTRSARKIYDANTRSMFTVAVEQLDEAVKLNPDNQTAITLKDRIQTSMGGVSVAVLSAADESKYQQAVQELQKGNKITASALVEQLLQNPKSRNSAKIQDLKKRIDSQL
jgi:tetratricopeptide (TPR) repeat protein